jgi:hypothetical protein
MFDSKYVATAMSMAGVTGWCCNFIVGLGFPYLQLWLGAWSFGPFACVQILTFLFAWLVLPETLGRSVEELHQNLLAKSQLKDLEESRVKQEVPTYGKFDPVEPTADVAKNGTF